MAVEWRLRSRAGTEFDGTCRKEVRIDKSWESLFDGDICLSMRDTKKIMAALQNAVVNHEAETYALLRRFCPDCHTLRPVTDYTTRRIQAVCGTIEVRNPRWMLCRECHPGQSSDTGADGTDGAARKHAALPAGAKGAGGFLSTEPTETHAIVRSDIAALGM